MRSLITILLFLFAGGTALADLTQDVHKKVQTSAQTGIEAVGRGTELRERFLASHDPADAVVALDSGIHDEAFITEILVERDHTTAPGIYLALMEYIMDLPVEKPQDIQRRWVATFKFIELAVRADLGELALATYVEYQAREERNLWNLPSNDTSERFNIGVPGTFRRPFALEQSLADLTHGLAATAIEENELELAQELLDQTVVIADRAELLLDLLGTREARESDIDRLERSSGGTFEELVEGLRHWEIGARYRYNNIAETRARRTFLLEILDPQLNADDAFDMVLFGWTENNEALTGAPWNSGSYNGSAAFGPYGRLMARYLRRHGYTALAETYGKRSHCSRSYNAPAIVSDDIAELGGLVFPRVRYYQQLVANRCTPAGHNAQPAEQGVRALLASLPNPRPTYFREMPMSAAPEVDLADQPDVWPNGIPGQVSEIIRREFDGEEWVIIYGSRALDPAGEVPTFGYWIVRTINNGQSWDRPYYLGLQKHFPYVVETESALPIVDGNTLRIAVHIDEIDRSSISFPPIGLRTANRQDGLYLEFEWSELIRDRDNDGLTDVFEHRLALDYENEDSDSDGFPDGSDPFPTSPYDPLSDSSVGFYLAVFERVLGEGAQAILTAPPTTDADNIDIADMLAAMVERSAAATSSPTTLLVSGAPEAFAGLRYASIPIIVHPNEVYEALSQAYGMTLPLSLPLIQPNSSGDVWYVEWNARWVGGTLIVRQIGETYEVEDLSYWIT